jgi:hypothetical protein
MEEWGLPALTGGGCRAASMWAKGATPIVQMASARHGMSLISAVISRGHTRFMITETLPWRPAQPIAISPARHPPHSTKSLPKRCKSGLNSANVDS